MMVANEDCCMTGGLLNEGDGTLGGGGGVIGGRNNNMSRLNGRVHHTGPQHGTSGQYQSVPTQYHQGPPGNYLGPEHHSEEYQPSCLVRTPSGNVYIPSDMPKPSTLEYKSSLHSPSLHSPVKGDQQKAMEGYNVPFGSGLPAPVLPVRNNLRRPGPGSRGVGGTSSSVGRVQGSPRCSWKCTAFVFIAIAVVLAAILVYIAATSSLAWSVHSQCAVLVDESSIITDTTHPGQTKSRGNIIEESNYIRRLPPSPEHDFLVVYEALQEQRPMQYPTNAEPSSRRMRRSVPHDLDPPSRMNTDPPLEHSTQINSQQFTTNNNPTTQSPDPDPNSVNDPSSSQIPHLPHSGPSSSSNNKINSESDSHVAFIQSENVPININGRHVSFPNVHIRNVASPDNTQNRQNGSSSSKGGEVFGSEVDIVEYIADSGDLPDANDNSGADEIADNEDDNQEDNDEVGDLYNNNNDNDSVESSSDSDFDYVYDNNPETGHTDILEYEEKEKMDSISSQQDPEEGYDSIPNSLLGDFIENIDASDGIPIPFDEFDPDVMVGDDPGVYNSKKKKRKSKPIRSWMGAFPTMPPATPRPIIVTETSPMPTLAPEIKSEHIKITFPSRKNLSEPLESVQVPVAISRPQNKTKIRRRPKQAINAWFVSYGNEITNHTRRKSLLSETLVKVDDDMDEELSKQFNDEQFDNDFEDPDVNSYDPDDPLGGPIPQSDPSQFPSRILRSLGVPKYRDRDYYDDSASTKKRQLTPQLAIDVFPHIFDYDLQNHDDYYYEEEENPYYYDTDFDYRNPSARTYQEHDFENIPEDDDESDVILNDKDLGVVQAAHRPAEMTMRPLQRLHVVTDGDIITATHYPPGLRSYNLIKDNFHLDVKEPQVQVISKAQREVVEVDVVPLKSNAKSERRADSWSSSNYQTGRDIVYKAMPGPVPVRSTTTSTTTTPAPITAPPTTTTTTTTTTTSTTSTTTTTAKPVTSGKPSQKENAKFLPTRSPPLAPRPVKLSNLDIYSTHDRKADNIPKFLKQTNEHVVPLQEKNAQYEYYHDIDKKGNIISRNHVGTYDPHVYETRNHRSVQATEPLPAYRKEDEVEFVEKEKYDSQYNAHESLATQFEYSNAKKEETTAFEDVSYRQHPFIPSSQHHVQRYGKQPNRITVNVTISSENEGPVNKQNPSKPLYVLSVSLPTSGENQKADINIVKPDDQQQIANLALTVLGNETYNEGSDRQYADQPYSSPLESATNLELPKGSDCQCPCPCNNDKNSIPIPSSFLPKQNLTKPTQGNGINDHLKYGQNTSNPDEVNSNNRSPVYVYCLPNPTTPASITTTDPPLSLEIERELEDHKNRPQKTIPPDGTTFKMMDLGQQLKSEIPPYGYWNMQFYQSESAYVRFDVNIPRGSSIGIYGRRNALPTHTSYDFLQVLSGYKTSSRTTRQIKAPPQKQYLTKYLEQGHWFLSLYNDDGDPQEVSLTGEVSTEYTEGCPKGCSGNGDCILGSCQCHPGFAGPDCTEMKCPVLCAGNGEYRNGECICRPGWKGRECSIRHDECEVPDCNGHGHCVDGKCRCAKGFKGEFCQEDDCPHPTCSGHGWCVAGKCVCQKGWRGADCGSTDDAALQCLPDCSGHGDFDLESHQCVCYPEWTGSECNKRVCGLDCGPHGRCEGGSCLCFPGWTGEHCDLMTCDPRCEEHGQCKNGTCICMTGWNGRHCTLAGCLNMCSGHGSCVIDNDEWTCQCHNQWEGEDCTVMLETNCADSIDNDNDGLVDCADAECCSSPSCTHSSLCLTSVDPIDILLRKQPPAVTASFFQRMRFIVEEGSVQNYAKGAAFNQSRASVVRGRVISGRGTGLRGVRVSHYLPGDMGFTLTRPGGWFDLMVNGGGAVRLLFGKSPFLPVTQTVWVPWNEIVVIETVKMTTADVVPPPPPTPCPNHNYDALKPVVLATWKHGFQGGCPEQSAILTESQVVQESLAIPGTGLHLVYHSSRALGYESTIQLQLTPSEIPETLRRIYLRITIEGILFEKTFEADPDIKFTYPWNRLNVYRQRVYGVTWAVVKVGFAYSNCEDQIIWDTQTTQVSGHDMSISDIGGWDLSIHHRYNFHEGILQKGDGRNLHIKQKPRVLRTLMGDGHQREIACRSCEGPSDKQRLLTPAALASGPDGSIYVADFNLIRRILPDNTVKTVVKLNETQVSYRYHLAVSPVSGDIYISDHEAHLILKVRDPDDYTRPEENYMPYVGSGERCLPGDEVGCGDGYLARDAKLQYPKGMAISLDEVLYFADGTNVRAVDSDGLINTVIGTHRHRAHWRPLPCEGTVPVTEVSLRWPTAVAVNPLDDSLYVLDDHHVLRLTRDGQVKVMAGRPLHCPPLAHDAPSDMAAHTTLRSPQSLAFAPNGDLYIAESDNERINRVRVIETDERIHDFAGADSKCNCQQETCPCYDDSHVLAATAVFSTISALTVTPDGVVHVLDQGNLRIRSVTSSIPEPNNLREYEIYSPETQEAYVFNRFGHHITTRSIPTGRKIYTFAYNVNTSNGKLASVTDAGANRVSFLRDYTGQVNRIENSRQQKCHLQMSRARQLEELVTPDEHNVSLTYHASTGLLRSRMDSTGRAYVYTYDKYGRLTRAVTPSGQVIDMTFDLSQKGARVTLTRDGTAPVSMLIKGALVTETIGAASSITAQLPDGSVITRTAWGHHTATETIPYTILQDHTLAHSYPVSGRQRTEIGDELVNSFDWKYFVEKVNRQSSVTQVGRKMRINGEDLLTFKYDLYTGTEAVLNENGATLLNVSYDDLGRPLRWSPAEPFLPVHLGYDRFGQLEKWSWGVMREDYAYDRAGRFESVTYADGTKVTYFFKDLSSVKPYKVSITGGSEHLLDHDEGGGLSTITTPKGQKYSFHVQPSLLHNRFTFTPPGAPRHPYQLFYNDDGRILAEVAPHQASRVVYSYDHTGRLHLQIYGDGSIEYGYHSETGLIRTVTIREQEFELRTDNKYHAGLVKEQHIRFGQGNGMDSVKLRFLYDGNARPRRVEMEINGKEQPDYDMKYNMILGTLESVGDLKVISSNHNKTVVQDARKTMLRETSFDPHGRIVESALTLRSRLVYRSRYGYDNRGRLAVMSTWRGPGSSELHTNYTYTPDGFLQAVDGAESWQFQYDANGNMISVVEGGREMTATYDDADRLIGWGDVELNTYSPSGTVVRQGEVHFTYTARGNIRSAWQQGQYKIWCRHDHRGRLSVWEDDHGNVTQFFYTDLRRPELPTHIHYPKKGVTHALEYNEQGHLMALHTGKRQYWISTDHIGSPVAVFDDSGVLIKEIVRSPWGATLKDTKPDLLLHIDFQGAIRDPLTGFLTFGLHTYDPVHAMWMSPRFDLVTSVPDHVGAVYVHRFHDNDPINSWSQEKKHYTDLDSWLKLYGVDLSKMLGSSYHDETVEMPKGRLEAPQLAPSLNVISGLSCSTESVLNQFAQPSLLPESLIRSASPAWAIPGWAALGRFSSSPPVLGPGVLISRVNGRAVVTLVPSRENPVVQDVARDVLNGSALLDVTFTHHHHHTLYLVKENGDSRHDDLQQLQRLSGQFNVTSKDEGEHHEVRVIGTDVSLVILYGTDAPTARRRLLRHEHHKAVNRAWEVEKLLLERGSPTNQQWSVDERAELMRDGYVSGYIAADHHSIHRFPLLSDDPTNVIFRHDSGRRRRRSKVASQT